MIDSAQLDLTPQKAEQLLRLRRGIVACQALDEHQFHGIEYFDRDALFGSLVGVDMRLFSPDMLVVGASAWVRLPTTPGPDQEESPSFLWDDTQDVENLMVVITEDGPYWCADYDMGTLTIETPILPWSVIENAASGNVVVPTANYAAINSNSDSEPLIDELDDDIGHEDVPMSDDDLV